ncbi:MAG: hypothetical protein PHR74_03815 [Candidatus Omnitrophica bacterium]|nr:hypothetical protein [Candidatus Omnitrophota bacterium]
MIKKFEKEIRPTSHLCKLSLNNKSIPWDRYDSSSRYPFAFVAYYFPNKLAKIDSVLNKFDIEKKGTKDFKNRLKDKSLSRNTNEEGLSQSNAILSTLIELFVADYLNGVKYEEIVDLSAWNVDCLSDIHSRGGKKEYYTEVKYLGEIPEEYELICNIIRKRRMFDANHIGTIGAFYNYVNLRIADAVFQFEKGNIPCENRRAFIVIKESLPMECIVPSLLKKENWDNLSWEALADSLNLSDKDRKKYMSDSIESYHKRAGELMISFLGSSYDLIIVANK